MLLEILGLLAVAAALAILLHLKYNHWRYSHIPGPPRQSFIFGHVTEIRRQMKADGCAGVYWLEKVREYGKIFNIWIIMRPVIFIADPLVIKNIVTDFRTFTRSNSQHDGFLSGHFSFGLSRMGTVSFCGFNSILTSDGGPVWKHKKRILDPAFSVQRLSKHLSKFYEIASSLSACIETAQKNNPGQFIDIESITAQYTADAISKAGFSANENSIQLLRSVNPKSRQKALEEIVSKGANRIHLMLDSVSRKKVLSATNDIRKVRGIGKNMIMERTSDGSFGNADDILDCVISANINEKSGSLDLEECLDDFMTMYAAGTATTSTTMLWSLAELTRNPLVMEKLVSEIDQFWIKAKIQKETNGDVIAETLKGMKYLDAFVKEILRYHPPVQMFRRSCSREVELCGYKIPSSTVLLGSNYAMQRWEEYWSEPEEFNPDRFLTSTPIPYTYIPFFLGPRQCIGKNFAILELKTMLCEILGRFDIKRDPSLPWKIKSIQAILCLPQDNKYSIMPRQVNV